MIKRIIALCFCALLTVLPVCGCGQRRNARAEIENELAEARAANEEKIKEAEKTDETPAQPAEVEAPAADAAESSPSASPQTEQSSPENAQTNDSAPAGAEALKTPDYKNDWDGITSSQYTVFGNRYYYYVKAKKTLPARGGGHHTTGVLAYVYTDLTQGGMLYVCPDPLCSHSDPSVCPFTAEGQSADFCPAGDGFFYFGRTIGWGDTEIFKADLNKGTVKTVCKGTVGTYIYGEENGVLYFNNSENIIDKDTRTTVQRDYLAALDVKTDEVLFEREIPGDQWIESIRGGKIICSSLRELREYDMNFENPKTLFSFDGTGWFGEWYYDENRDEFWFSVRDREKESGAVYRILPDGTCERVPLPAEQIYYFELTNTKIYFSPYDPTKLSENPDYRLGTVDYTNGKIYAVDRDDPGGEPTLVYDCAGKYYIGEPDVSDYVIFGDDLYFSLLKVTRRIHEVTGEEYLTFDMSGDYPKVHVNLSTGEEEIYRFD